MIKELEVTTTSKHINKTEGNKDLFVNSFLYYITWYDTLQTKQQHEGASNMILLCK